MERAMVMMPEWVLRCRDPCLQVVAAFKILTSDPQVSLLALRRACLF